MVCRLLDLFIVSGFLLSIRIFTLNSMRLGLDRPVGFLFIFWEMHKKLVANFFCRAVSYDQKFSFGIGQSIAAPENTVCASRWLQSGTPSYPRTQPKSLEIHFPKIDFA